MNKSTPNISRQSGGVRHPPEAAIESICDILRGYGSAGSIFKELIQNAEDAGSSRMDLLRFPGDPASHHSLLQGPGLVVVNDGAFNEEHRNAISQISLGTKGTEERSIGRFGKRRKSVFGWCEAFYIIARTNPRLGWSTPAIIDLFNPWHSWRHSDWEVEFEEYRDSILEETENHLTANVPRVGQTNLPKAKMERRRNYHDSLDEIRPVWLRSA